MVSERKKKGKKELSLKRKGKWEKKAVRMPKTPPLSKRGKKNKQAGGGRGNLTRKKGKKKECSDNERKGIRD